ncbi:MAG: hypothetical protein ACR2QK_09075 [Acidimicrobiales bacterium]
MSYNHPESNPRPSSETNGLSYARFGAWYDGYRQTVLEPALEAGMEALETAIVDGLSDRDLSRIRNLSGRVKSKRRTWRKIQQSQYAETIHSTDDIPREIHDLVGLRITCTNLRDIDTVQAALDALPTRQSRQFGLSVNMTAERDYVRAPKESGYRGWHVPLTIDIDRDGTAEPVICELQVRTLLQDSWGELTHEDTYSKDGELPPLVEVLSKRIADLFATLDDIAEDLRTELDRIDEAAIAEVDDSLVVPDSLTESGQAADAASMLLDRWQHLDRPVDLASLAWAVQLEFGAEVNDGWFGYGSFKRFLAAAVPDGDISTGGQAYLLPDRYDPEAEPIPNGEAEPTPDGPPPAATETSRPTPQDQSAGAGQPASGAPSGRGRSADRGGDVDRSTGRSEGEPPPEAARRLRSIDRAFPLLATEDWALLYDGLAEAWRRFGTVEASPRVVNRLTKSARDRAESAGVTLSRRHLDYVAKAVFAAGHDAEPLDADEIAARFAALTVQRMIDFRILRAKNERARSEVTAWLGAG